jgi:hypothetical protein
VVNPSPNQDVGAGGREKTGAQMRRHKHVATPPMKYAATGQERKQQQELLRDLYRDYKGARHYWFVLRYNKEHAKE